MKKLIPLLLASFFALAWVAGCSDPAPPEPAAESLAGSWFGKTTRPREMLGQVQLRLELDHSMEVLEATGELEFGRGREPAFPVVGRVEGYTLKLQLNQSSPKKTSGWERVEIEATVDHAEGPPECQKILSWAGFKETDSKSDNRMEGHNRLVELPSHLRYLEGELTFVKVPIAKEATVAARAEGKTLEEGPDAETLLLTESVPFVAVDLKPLKVELDRP